MHKKHTSSLKKIKYFPSSLLIPLSSFLIFSIGFVPLIGYIILVQYLIGLFYPWIIIGFPFLFYLGISIVVISQMFFSALMVSVFHMNYVPGTFPYHTKEKNALKWMIIVTIYTPIRKILEIIPMGELKLIYLRLMGMHIGNNSLIGGIIKDPCVTSIGNHTTMGEYAIVYGHIHNYEKNSIMIDPVTIGDNCVIGAGAIIMPGVVIEDGVIVAAGALVPKKQRLISGHTYAGIPAKQI